jgi:hypothetical protein
MIKNRRINLTVFAIAIAIASASAMKFRSTRSGTGEPTLYWFNTTFIFQELTTETSEINKTGCTGALIVCERAYTASQLNDPGDPAQGVKADQQESPLAIIFHNED